MVQLWKVPKLERWNFRCLLCYYLFYFQICLSLIYLFLPGSLSQTDQIAELMLCKLLKHTPNYSIYKLHDKSNCHSHVKVFGDVACLRNGENKVRNTKNFILNIKTQNITLKSIINKLKTRQKIIFCYLIYNVIFTSLKVFFIR